MKVTLGYKGGKSCKHKNMVSSDMGVFAAYQDMKTNIHIVDQIVLVLLR